MSAPTHITLYNTLNRKKEPFLPIDESNVRLYVCGPTVYDFAHIGNARPAIVFDVLFRLLRHIYGAEHVTYVRNITDVDDKINARAARDFPDLPLNDAIARVTEKTAAQYFKDTAIIGCLDPSEQPRATQHIDGMATMIQTLIDKGHAYIAKGTEGREVLFDVRAMPGYGQLSGRNLEDQKAGARVATEAHKKHPADFVLWKESSDEEPGWDVTFIERGSTSTSIRGRPGWHIECSFMSKAFLGEVFDIHGGGLDLIFPHHENELAQSRCAHGTDTMANVWMHNGFLQVEGEKMSKSLGNFVTIQELLETEKFGGRSWPGEVMRLAMLMTQYRQPIDWTVRQLEESETILDGWYAAIGDVEPGPVSRDVLKSISDDLNTPKAIGNLHALKSSPATLKATANILGLLEMSGAAWLDSKKKEFDVDEEAIADFIAARAKARANKNWAESDRIRDEMAAMGIQLKDSKDLATGKLVTTWDIVR